VSRGSWPTILQRNQLYQDGIASYTVMVDGTVLIDRSVTTYQVNAYNQPDITWLDVETRLQMVYFVRYMRQRITQKYGRCALANDNPTGNPGIVTAKILKAECVHVYKELEAVWWITRSCLRRPWWSSGRATRTASMPICRSTWSTNSACSPPTLRRSCSATRPDYGSAGSIRRCRPHQQP